MTIENPLVFYPRYRLGAAVGLRADGGRSSETLALRPQRPARPARQAYTDAALTEATSDYDSLEMFQLSDSARAAGAKASGSRSTSGLPLPRLSTRR